MTTPATGETEDTRSKWFVMAAVASSVLLATIDGSIVNVAFPTLVAELHTTFSTIQWVALGYLLTLATLTLGMGRLGDVMGKKKIFTSGFVLFILASALCGISTSVGWLIGFRVLQGVGSVMILALGAAILVEAFPFHERGKALGWIGTAVSAGVITGPVVGGLLISSFSWRAIFFVNVPVGIVGTYLAVRYVPDRPPIPGQRFDYPGAILLSGALFSLSLALTLGQELGFGSATIVALFTTAAILALAFVFVELRTENPMLQLRLFSSHMLSVSVTTGFLAFACLSSVFFLLPFYLEGVLGFDVRTVGLLLGVSPLMLGVVSPMSGVLSDRIGIRRLTLTGLILLTISFLGLSRLAVDTSVPYFLTVTALLGLGIGIFQSPNNSAIMSSVPPEYMGIGSGLLTITRLLGQITGVAVMGTIWATRVAALSGGSLPEGGASFAPALAQAGGLHFTYSIAAALLAVATVIGAWGLSQERRGRRLESLPAEG